jgi:uncharacterized caspase-like protein
MNKFIKFTLLNIFLGYAIVFPCEAIAEKRIALVFGNSAYLYSNPIKNPVNDARAISEALDKLGFSVIRGTDLTKLEMDRQVETFAKRLKDADIAIFFYAGHGLQLNMKNYLVPIDFNPNSDAYLITMLVSMDTILSILEKEKRVSIIFLDACRDNPLASKLSANMGRGRSLLFDENRGVRVIRQGLAEVEGKAGTLIAYATQPGNIALDGTGRNSPFTEALLQYITIPGLEVRDMLTKVRARVIKKTREKQIPWDHSSLVEEIYLKKKKKRFAPPP